MNLDLDFSAVSRFFRGIGNELKTKKLWPVAVVLLAAIVAVPFLLSKSSSPAPIAQTPLPAGPPPAASSLPALNVQTTPAPSHLAGSARNPFGSSSSSTPTSASSPSTSATTAVASTATAAHNALSSLSGGSSTGGSSPSGSSTTGSSTGSSGSSPAPASSGSNPPSITPNAHPKPAPTGLTSTQSYDVSMAMTVGQGGVTTVDPLERLSVIPSAQEPQLVELGVLQGGNRVLFAVQPGTVLSGPGTCTPGPIDCEILSLGPDQTESVAQQTPNGPTPAVLFALTGISAVNHGSAAAAVRARHQASAAGRTLLDRSTSQTLSLFQYDPSLGSVVDLRNLTTVGGS